MKVAHFAAINKQEYVDIKTAPCSTLISTRIQTTLTASSPEQTQGRNQLCYRVSLQWFEPGANPG